MIITMAIDEAARNLARWNGWSYQHARALCEYVEQLSEEIGEPIEFDPVAWRCDWSVYDSATEAADELLTDWREYNDVPDETWTAEEIEDAALDALQEAGALACVSEDGVIVCWNNF